MSYNELDKLAEELRELILDVVSKNGGHLAPNLGVVELTIALMRALDLEKDSIIWDVGHQSYTYKILTDRLHKIYSLRQFGGISGFTKPSESPYDKSISGHTSTSISVAMGIHATNSYKENKQKVVAVIGDGAMGGGQAFEALNNLCNLENKNIMVILNDNEMSISKNTGGIATYLSKIINGQLATTIKKDIQNIIEDAPLGDKVISFAKRIESSVVGFVSPGLIFENLGIKYIGPIDGHKIKDVEKAINNGFLQNMPVLVHVVTTKGKGYEAAECEPDRFHGVSAFDVESGKAPSSKKISWTNLFGNKLVELANIDERVVAITAAMTDGTGLKAFSEKYPDKFHDVGIAEQHATAFAAGLALGGYRPYFAVYSTFLQRAYDQLIHDVAIDCLPVTFCIDRGGLVGADGATHHGAFDISLLNAIPNMGIFLPKDDYEFNAMMDLSLECDFPVAIRYPRGDVQTYPFEKKEVELGMIEAICSGDDVLIVSTGHIFEESYKLYNLLIENNTSTSLINLRFLKPFSDNALDELVNSARGKKLIVTMEDGSIRGGAGETVVNKLVDNGVYVPVMKVGLPDAFVQHGTVSELRNFLGIDAQSVFEEICKRL